MSGVIPRTSTYSPAAPTPSQANGRRGEVAGGRGRAHVCSPACPAPAALPASCLCTDLCRQQGADARLNSKLCALEIKITLLEKPPKRRRASQKGAYDFFFGPLPYVPCLAALPSLSPLLAALSAVYTVIPPGPAILRLCHHHSDTRVVCRAGSSSRPVCPPAKLCRPATEGFAARALDPTRRPPPP